MARPVQHAGHGVDEGIAFAVAQRLGAHKLQSEPAAMVGQDLGDRSQAVSVKGEVFVKRALFVAGHDPGGRAQAAKLCRQLGLGRQLFQARPARPLRRCGSRPACPRSRGGRLRRRQIGDVGDAMLISTNCGRLIDGKVDAAETKPLGCIDGLSEARPEHRSCRCSNWCT